jgi:hypothetical protein
MRAMNLNNIDSSNRVSYFSSFLGLEGETCLKDLLGTDVKQPYFW